MCRVGPAFRKPVRVLEQFAPTTPSVFLAASRQSAEAGRVAVAGEPFLEVLDLLLAPHRPGAGMDRDTSVLLVPGTPVETPVVYAPEAAESPHLFSLSRTSGTATNAAKRMNCLRIYGRSAEI